MLASMLPASPPAEKATIKREARVRRARIGAYRGPAAADGLNSLTRTITLEFSDTLDRINIIKDFIEERGGHLPFFWRNLDGNLVLVRCPSWRGPRKEGALRRALTLEIVEDHSLGYRLHSTALEAAFPGVAGAASVELTIAAPNGVPLWAAFPGVAGAASVKLAILTPNGVPLWAAFPGVAGAASVELTVAAAPQIRSYNLGDARSEGRWLGSWGPLATDLVDGGGVAYLRLFRVQGNSLRITTSDSPTSNRDDAGPQLSADWLGAAEAFTIEIGSTTVTLPGPSHSSNAYSDPTEPHFWTPPASIWTEELKTYFLTTNGDLTFTFHEV